jgi:predicted N-formylglutamate amidohydrolase
MNKDEVCRLKIDSSSNIFLTCEHASRNIPREYENLGLSESQKENCKDLYDVGALEMTNFLAKELKAGALCSDISRLVIDCNRRLDAKNKNENKHHACALKTELLVEEAGIEKMIEIPGNIFLDQEKYRTEEKRRYEKYATPYLNAAYSAIDELRKKHKKSYIIQLHSFYPTYNGDKRTVDIGVLYDQAKESAGRIARNLQKKTSLCVAENKPWSIKDTDGIVFKEVEKMSDVEVIVFDINNKHLRTQEGIEKIAKLIFLAIKEELVV